WRATASVRDLRQLVRYRQQLVEQRRATKLRVRALLREHRCRPSMAVNPWTKAWRSWVESIAIGSLGRWVMDRHLLELQRLAKAIPEGGERFGQATADDAAGQRLRGQTGVGAGTPRGMRVGDGRV